jgi:carboxymethylenebutenolidase
MRPPAWCRRLRRASRGTRNLPRMTGTPVDVHTPDGVMDCYTFTPPGSGRWPPVIVYMDAFGIRSELGEMAGRLAGNGFLVVLPNLYYRTGPFPPFDRQAVLADGPERDRFKAMIQSINREMVMRDTAAILARLDGDPRARAGQVGVVGYCMGGGYALSAAGTFTERVAVAASFHGGSLATERPDSPHTLAPAVRARVYIGAAEIDPTFPPEQQERLRRAFDAAGVNYQLEIYPAARHGFAVTGHLAYDAGSSERHWSTLIALLKDTLH